jgi:predicted transcriptional regulator
MSSAIAESPTSPNKLSRSVRVSDVQIHTTLPRNLAERLYAVADMESSTVAGIIRRAISSFVQAQGAVRQ